ncbi:hypothetical protein QBC39DRAFT_20204 [Podospora conica]|nr:hypothetical protein QBC39DRAFT_20204 [Schizothecium conicum]
MARLVSWSVALHQPYGRQSLGILKNQTHHVGLNGCLKEAHTKDGEPGEETRPPSLPVTPKCPARVGEGRDTDEAGLLRKLQKRWRGWVQSNPPFSRAVSRPSQLAPLQHIHLVHLDVLHGSMPAVAASSSEWCAPPTTLEPLSIINLQPDRSPHCILRAGMQTPDSNGFGSVLTAVARNTFCCRFQRDVRTDLTKSRWNLPIGCLACRGWCGFWLAPKEGRDSRRGLQVVLGRRRQWIVNATHAGLTRAAMHDRRNQIPFPARHQRRPTSEIVVLGRDLCRYYLRSLYS